MVESGTGKLLDSFSFNSWYRDGSYDLVRFNAYLYTADASGNPASESARCPSRCTTAVYSGEPQLVSPNMSTAYTTFDVYLIGTSTTTATPVPFDFDPTFGLVFLGGAWLVRKGLKKRSNQKIAKENLLLK